ncbi:hypothetical protein [Nocardia sp. NPDC057030]|uniref:hypothetical protein n=1 Tax=unclassified Nocardia TaxID=2637762 RepID=UPI003636BF07
MSTPIDEFDLDIRLRDLPVPAHSHSPLRGRSDGPEQCPTDDCSSYPMCNTNQRTC